MTSAGLLRRLGRYGAVGVLAAVVHLSVLISLEMVIPSWLANPLADQSATHWLANPVVDQYITH